LIASWSPTQAARRQLCDRLVGPSEPEHGAGSAPAGCRVYPGPAGVREPPGEARDSRRRRRGRPPVPDVKACSSAGRTDRRSACSAGASSSRYWAMPPAAGARDELHDGRPGELRRVLTAGSGVMRWCGGRRTAAHEAVREPLTGARLAPSDHGGRTKPTGDQWTVRFTIFSRGHRRSGAVRTIAARALGEIRKSRDPESTLTSSASERNPSGEPSDPAPPHPTHHHK